MKVRNIPYKKLNQKEKRVVNDYFKECKEDFEERNNKKYYKNVEEFWKDQKLDLTLNGNYDGWVIDELEGLILDKLQKIKKKMNDIK